MERRLSKFFSRVRGKSRPVTKQEVNFVVNNIGAYIPSLGRELQLTPTQEAELQLGRQILREKAHKLIEMWIQKDGQKATKKVLVKALKSIGRKDMADELNNSSTDEEIITDFTKFQQCLVEKYSHLYMPQPPGIQKQILIDDMFVDPRMNYHSSHDFFGSLERGQQFLQLLDTWNTILNEDEPIAETLTELTRCLNEAQQLLNPNEVTVSADQTTYLELQSRMIQLMNSFMSESQILRNLFQHVMKDDTARILLEGGPGCGKTTLIAKLAADWAKEKEYICSRFNIVISILLKNVENQLEDVIVALINNAIDKQTVKRGNLEQFLDRYKVLLLLDGYDEMNSTGKRALNTILTKHNQSSLSSACILVTSRSGQFSGGTGIQHSASSVLFLDDGAMENVWDIHLEVIGLMVQQGKELIQKQFDISEDTMQAKISELFIGRADEILQRPQLTFLFGHMLGKSKTVANQTRTMFYQDFINLILQCTLIREKKINETDEIDIFAPSTNDVASAARDQICELGKLALERLMDNDENSSFADSELGSLSESTLLQSNIFVKTTNTRQREVEIHYRPVHKIFLEFIAAFSVCNAREHEHEPVDYHKFKEKITSLVDHKDYHPSKLPLFFPFVVGLLKNRAHWLFSSFTRWSPIYTICEKEMVNVLLELTTVNDQLIDSLIDHVPNDFTIPQFQDTSDCHKLLLRAVLNINKKNLMSFQQWNLDIFDGIPKDIPELECLHLIATDQIRCQRPRLFPIRCKEVITFINGNLSSTSWNVYVSFYKTIKADQHHISFCQSDASTCTMVLEDMEQGAIMSRVSFQRVKFLNCELENIHLVTLIELVNNYRITKGISLTMNSENTQKLAAIILSELWIAVAQSNFIDEFTFFNSSRELIPEFDFSLIDSMERPTFKAIYMYGGFILNQSNVTFGEQSIQELSLRSHEMETSDVTNLLSRIRVTYFECSASVFFATLSNDFAGFYSSLQELNLNISDGDFSLPTSFSDLYEQIGLNCLQSLVLSFQNDTGLSDSSQSELTEFLSVIMKANNLQILGLNHVETASLFDSLMNVLLEEKLYPRGLELSNATEQWTAQCSSLSLVKSCLEQKLLEYFAITTDSNLLSVSSLANSKLLEDKFQVTLEMNGYEEHHSIFSQKLLKNMHRCYRYRVELQN